MGTLAAYALARKKYVAQEENKLLAGVTSALVSLAVFAFFRSRDWDNEIDKEKDNEMGKEKDKDLQDRNEE